MDSWIIFRMSKGWTVGFQLKLVIVELDEEETLALDYFSPGTHTHFHLQDHEIATLHYNLYSAIRTPWVAMGKPVSALDLTQQHVDS